jgi:prevent-host-death family protein
MQTVNIHEAKTHLSRLVDEAAKGNVFIIAKAGKPMVKVLPLSGEETDTTKKLGFMSGEIEVPDDFDSLGATEITALFDRLLLAQARTEGMILLTVDASVSQYKESALTLTS